MPTMNTVDLRAEAAAEVCRLAAARALLRDGDQRALVHLEADAAWIAVARRGRLKQSLGRRVCLVWRVAFEDASGRLVESRLVPVLLDVPPGGGRGSSDRTRRAWIASLIRETDVPVRARVEAECDQWRATVARVAAAFTSARLSRERDISGWPSASPAAASQQGLFDRRAERSREAHETAAADSERAREGRLRAIAGDGAIARRPARLMLVLAP